jgi:hypothetical protein
MKDNNPNIKYFNVGLQSIVLTAPKYTFNRKVRCYTQTKAPITKSPILILSPCFLEMNDRKSWQKQTLIKKGGESNFSYYLLILS